MFIGVNLRRQLVTNAHATWFIEPIPLVPKEMTLKEMELWIEYMKPAYGAPVKSRKQAR